MASPMQPSSQLIEWLKGREVFKSIVYKDQGGRDTIGYGHLVRPGEVFGAISSVEATALLVRDMQPMVAAINAAITVPTSQQQFDAYCGLTFNVGTHWLEGSGLLTAINSGAPALQVEMHWLQYDKVNGVPSEGLDRRRASEWNIYAKGIYAGW